MSKAAWNNRAKQLKPNNPTYTSSRASTKAAANSRASQLKPNDGNNNKAHWSSRDGEQPSEQRKNNHPGARAGYGTMPDLRSVVPLKSTRLDGDEEEKRKEEIREAEALSDGAFLISWDEFSDILNAAIETQDTAELVAVMKGEPTFPPEQLRQAVSKIMIDESVFALEKIVPYVEASLLTDLILSFNWEKMRPAHSMVPDYASFYRDYIGYHIAKKSSNKVMPQLIAALSEGTPERQFLAADLIKKTKDQSLTEPEIYHYYGSAKFNPSLEV